MITKRARLWVSRGVAGTLMVAVALVAASTWFYAGRIRSELLASFPQVGARNQQVLAVDADSMTLTLDAVTGLPGTWGLEFDGGYAELGDVVASGEDTVTRRITGVVGSPTVGMAAALDRMAFPGDPSSRLVSFQEVLVPGPLGDYAAWLGDGVDDTWVLFVHDLGTDRRESLRVLPTVAELGFPTLVITYRGDVGAPSGRDGPGMGSDEWPDLQAAVEFAVSAGASDVVLLGYGAGGSLIELFMRESRLAGIVSGIVLDAPLLDAGEIVHQAAIADQVPGFIFQWAKGVSALRFGIDWSDLDHLSRAADTAVPTLIIHGEQDASCPVGTSRRYAEAAPSLVHLVVVPGAGHGEAWNLDPATYQAALGGFLAQFASGGPTAPGGG